MGSSVATQDDVQNLQLQIDNLNGRLDGVAVAATFSAQNAKLAPAGSIPKRITNLTATPNVKSITYAWDAALVQDLKLYQLDISTNSSMAGATSYETTQTTFTFTQGNSDTTYYARVFAKTKANKTSPASVTVQSTTGQAATNDLGTSVVTTTKLADGATTVDKIAVNAVVNIQLATTSPAQVIGTSWADITGGAVSITANSDRSTFIFFANSEATNALTGTPTDTQNNLQLRLSVASGASPAPGDFTILYTSGAANIKTSGSGVTTNVAGLVDQPGSGVWTYKIECQYTNKSNASDTLTLNRLIFVVEGYNV